MKTERVWRVGELARETGVSVRTLHYYEEIGLLVPSQRSRAGHRLYDQADIARLQRILSLRQLGLSLDDIGACLGDPEFTPLRVIEMQLHRVRIALEQQKRLVAQLESVAHQLRDGQLLSTDQVFRIIKETIMFEKYYTPEQLKELEERRAEVGEDRIREVENEWKTLFAELRAEMDKGSDPGCDSVQALARRAQALIREFTGGNPGIERSLGNMYKSEPGAVSHFGMDPAVFEYLGRARAKLAD